MGGARLLELDPNHFFRLMNMTIRNQPNSRGKAHSDQDVANIASSSVWKCGDHGWIVFENYCQEGVAHAISSDGETVDSCLGPLDNVP